MACFIIVQIMIEQYRVIKKYKSFILGYCHCGCGTEFKNVKKRENILRRFIHNHHMVGRTMELCPSWKGGRKLDRDYWMLFMPDYSSADKHGYVYEHVYFYQEYYQCSLLPWGVVHHIIPVSKGYCNNMIYNLLGMTRSQHMKLHTIIDMSDRKCTECSSTDTYIKKNGRPQWNYNMKGELICCKCFRKYRKKKQIKTLQAPKMI